MKPGFKLLSTAQQSRSSRPAVATPECVLLLFGHRHQQSDQLEQQLSQADQQRRRLLEAVFAEALVEPEKTLEAAYA
jgi:hypothetical protein